MPWTLSELEGVIKDLKSGKVMNVSQSMLTALKGKGLKLNIGTSSNGRYSVSVKDEAPTISERCQKATDSWNAQNAHAMDGEKCWLCGKEATEKEKVNSSIKPVCTECKKKGTKIRFDKNFKF